MNSCWGCRRGITKCRQGLRYWRHRAIFPQPTPPHHASISGRFVSDLPSHHILSLLALATISNLYDLNVLPARPRVRLLAATVWVSHAPGGAADRNTFLKTAEMSCYFGLMVPEGEIEGRERAKETGRGFHVLCHTFRDQAWVSQLEKQSDSLTRIPSYFCH